MALSRNFNSVFWAPLVASGSSLHVTKSVTCYRGRCDGSNNAVNSGRFDEGGYIAWGNNYDWYYFVLSVVFLIYFILFSSLYVFLSLFPSFFPFLLFFFNCIFLFLHFLFLLSPPFSSSPSFLSFFIFPSSVLESN